MRGQSWRLSNAEVLQTLHTRTEPPFVFAYDSRDNDMGRMFKSGIVEPTLSHAWYEATAECCGGAPPASGPT